MMSWLALSHFREWWGEPEKEWQLIEEGLETGEAVPFLVLDGERAVAYIQYWPVSLARGKVDMSEELWLRTLGDEVIGVDISLGADVPLGQGLGREILRQFVRKLRAEGFDEIVIDPDIRNERAIRAYQAAGFRRIGQYPEDEGGTLLMRFVGED